MADKELKLQFGDDIVIKLHDNGDGTWSPQVYTAAGQQVDAAPQASNPAHTSTPAVNTAAVLTLVAGGAGVAHVIASIDWSYNDDPTGGSLIITDGGVAEWTVAVTNGGPGFFSWEPPRSFSLNSQVIVTLAAGGAGVTGTLNIHSWTV